MRLRHTEEAAYITVETSPSNPFFTAGKTGAQKHFDFCTAARQSGMPPHERKMVGGAPLYVAYEGMEILGNTYTHSDDLLRSQGCTRYGQNLVTLTNLGH